MTENRPVASNYRPKLKDIMATCETNYMLLIKLLAGNDKVNQIRNFSISEHLSYSLIIDEVTKYTSVVSIKQVNGADEAQIQQTSPVKQLLNPSMQIRLYHDARIAEVLSCQGIRRIQPRYDYPNAKMHQPDEKSQVNIFLAEWLHMCIQQGQANIDLKVGDYE